MITEIMILIALAFYIKAIVLSIYIYTQHKKLTTWLKNHAPMTWETYKRLGK